MEKINLKQFIDKSENGRYGIVIENIVLENEVFDGSNLIWFEIINCTFKNVVFKNCNGELRILCENCSFYDCTFENITSKEFDISAKYNYYINCKFKNIHIEDFVEQSSVYYEKFENCIFEEIHLWADICSFDFSIEKSILNNFYCHIHDIECWKIVDSKIKNTTLKSTMIDNCFQNVEFDEFKITSGESDIDTNIFIDCDKEKVEITTWD